MSQGLPCTIGYIEAKPILKTDNVRGILLGEFPVQYEAFDDQVASGKIFGSLKTISYKRDSNRSL